MFTILKNQNSQVITGGYFTNTLYASNNTVTDMIASTTLNVYAVSTTNFRILVRVGMVSKV